MTRRAFAAAVARHGTDLAVWPAAAREAALALLERSGAARTDFARALAADTAANSASDNALGERLLMRLREALPAAMPDQRSAPRRLGPPVLGWGAVAAAVALGLWLGSGTTGAGPAPSPDLFASAQLAPLGADQP